MRISSKLLLILTSVIVVNAGKAMYPPKEIIVDLPKEFKFEVQEGNCNLPENPEEFFKEIKVTYGHLYKEDFIDKLDISAIKSKYSSFLTNTIEAQGKVISVKFDVLGFVNLFKFNTDLVREAFKKGSIPFVVKYNLKLQIKRDKRDDEIIHNITFSRFFGGNPIIDETNSDMFVHLQDRFCPSQMVLAEREHEETIQKKK